MDGKGWVSAGSIDGNLVLSSLIPFGALCQNVVARILMHCDFVFVFSTVRQCSPRKVVLILCSECSPGKRGSYTGIYEKVVG